MKAAEAELSHLSEAVQIDCYVADLSLLGDAQEMAFEILKAHSNIDVLINNAGVYSSYKTTTRDGLDIRFAVNTIAPYILTMRLLPLFRPDGRVVNVTSAAQFPVESSVLAGRVGRSDGETYGQSKLALAMWSYHLACLLKDDGPEIITVNPGSMLATKMVKTAFGIDGSAPMIGAEILARAALADEFSGASGLYFDNDLKQFTHPHPDVLNAGKIDLLVREIEEIILKTLR